MVDHRSARRSVADFMWASRLSRARRRLHFTPLRGDLAVFDLPLALIELLLARRRDALLERDGVPGIILLRGRPAPPGKVTASSHAWFILVVAAAVAVFWLAPVLVVLFAMFVGAGRLVTSLEAPPSSIGVFLAIAVATWTFVFVARLFTWGAKKSVDDVDRLAASMDWLAPTVHAAVSAGKAPLADWLVDELTFYAKQRRSPITVNTSRLVAGEKLHSSFQRSPHWHPVVVANKVGPSSRLFITNPTNLQTSATEVAQHRMERGLSTAVRVGVIAVLAYLFVGPIGGYAAWLADVDFKANTATPSPALGSVWDSLYWGLSMVTGFGGDAPSSLPGRAVAVLLQIASLVLTAGLVASLLGAIIEQSRRVGDRQARSDVEAFVRAGLVTSPRAARRLCPSKRVARRLSP